MEVSTSAYYVWVKQPDDTYKRAERQKQEQQAEQFFVESKSSYGSRRLSDALGKAGFPVGRYKARRIMAKLNLRARHPKRFKATTDSKHNDAISPNLLDRQFNVAKPNQVWTTDITYVWTLKGWLYVAIVVDLFSRQIVGWSVDDHIPTGHKCARRCVLTHCKYPHGALVAFWRKKPNPGLLHHSDRGSQYASEEYRQHLKVMKMEQSTSAPCGYEPQRELLG
jgi:transposase InsO family protein